MPATSWHIKKVNPQKATKAITSTSILNTLFMLQTLPFQISLHHRPQPSSPFGGSAFTFPNPNGESESAGGVSSLNLKKNRDDLTTREVAKYV